MKTRSIEKDDWKVIEALLSKEFSKETTKERINYLKDLKKAGCKMTIGLMNFNIVGFSVKKNNETIERFIIKDCRRLVISKNL